MQNLHGTYLKFQYVVSFSISKTDFLITKKHIETDNSTVKHKLFGKWVLYCNASVKETKKPDGASIFIIGDMVSAYPQSKNITISAIKGNFYLIISKPDELLIYNSLWSMLPIYYTENFDFISSSIQWIKNLNTISLNKQFIVENILFNYAFGNDTLYENIKLLPANTNINISQNTVKITKHTHVEDLFSKKTIQVSKKQIAENFIENIQPYFPNDKFAVTFTSGFDGRTILSCATNHFQQLITTSVGIAGGDDVEIPKKQAKLLGLPYWFLDLHNNNYLQKHYMNHANNIIRHSPGFNALIYPHFSYMAEAISEKGYKFLHCGYFGSELFRALHLSGALISDELIGLFTASSYQEYKATIMNAEKLKILNTNNFKDEIQAVINKTWEYVSTIINQLSKNQRFYKFVFEEMLRKVFGTWLTAQSKYLTPRTPFLDFNFIQLLLTTKYAGVNNEFRVKNPIKRFKGQEVYAEIIRQTNNDLYNMKTGREYAPADLSEILRYKNIIIPFIKKKTKTKLTKQFLDNLGIVSGAKQNETQLLELLKYPELFNTDLIASKFKQLTPYTNETERDLILHSLSIIKSI